MALLGRFGSRSQWFFAELIIIVSGVLIALAIDEFRGKREDAELELRYLEQLISDLRTAEDQITEAAAGFAAPERAGQRLLAAFEDGKPVTLQDAGQWLSEMRYFSTPIPVLGTLEALISTGDLRLIKNPDTRSGITQYLSSTQNRIDRYDRYEELSRDLYIRILILAQTNGITPSHRSGLSIGVPGADSAGFFADPEAYSLVERFVANKSLMAAHRDEMLIEARELRELLSGQL